MAEPQHNPKWPVSFLTPIHLELLISSDQLNIYQALTNTVPCDSSVEEESAEDSVPSNEDNSIIIPSDDGSVPYFYLRFLNLPLGYALIPYFIADPDLQNGPALKVSRPHSIMDAYYVLVPQAKVPSAQALNLQEFAAKLKKFETKFIPTDQIYCIQEHPVYKPLGRDGVPDNPIIKDNPRLPSEFKEMAVALRRAKYYPLDDSLLVRRNYNFKGQTHSVDVSAPHLETKNALIISPSPAKLIKAANEVEYLPLPYSSLDFMAVVKELVFAVPYPPPGHLRGMETDVIFFAPYTTMVQSSCTGKTRFLLDPIKEDDDSRSLVIYFTMNSNLVGQKVTYFFLNKLIAALRNLPLGQAAAFMEMAYDSVIDEVVDSSGRLKSEYSNRGGYHADLILERMMPLPDEPPSHYIPKKRSLTVQDAKTGRDKMLFVVLAIDEAHLLLDMKRPDGPELKSPQRTDISSYQDECENERESEFGTLQENISLFTVLRRTERYCDVLNDLRIPLILTSTNSRISNFMPHHNYDPSRRDLLVSTSTSRIEYLHRPILLQESFDAWARMLTIQDKSPYDYVKSQEFLENLFEHGRPFWGALKSGSTQAFPIKFNEILKMARSKLLAESEDIPTSVDALALLGQTVYIEPIPTSEYASKLVEARMGFCFMVDNIQHYYLAGVYPEPVLSLVAATTLFHENVRSLRNCLQQFSRLTEIGHADVGADGEFVVRTAFWIARMLAPPLQNAAYKVDHMLLAACPRRLLDMLNCLAPVNQHLTNIIGSFLPDALVSFTHWVRLEAMWKMNEEGTQKFNLSFKNTLEQALIRSSALLMPVGFEGVDLVIPLVTPSGIGALLIQVKNYVENDDVVQSKALEKMVLFAEQNDLGGRCAYALVFISPKKDDQPSSISSFHGNALRPLRKRQVIDEKENLPALMIYGVNYLFGENDPPKKANGHASGELSLNKRDIPGIRTLLADLANMYRGSRRRLVPKFAHYYQRNEKIFLNDTTESQPKQKHRRLK